VPWSALLFKMALTPGRARATIIHDRRAVVPDSRLRHASLAAAFIVLCASAGFPQTSTTNGSQDTPVFRVRVVGYVVADFSARVSSYMELRSRLEEGLPPLAVTEYPEEIASAQHALAERIREAREGAKQGEIFTPEITQEFKKVLLLEMDADSRAAMMDDNPGEIEHHINGTYPRRTTFSTVPGNILAALPRLPDDLQYRFLGRNLILLDTRSNVILDRIPCALRCAKQ